MKNLKKGFTLIELLVVVAIIGILASVVLASLNTARTKGADAAIKANLANTRAQAAIYYDSATNNTYGAVTLGSSCSYTAAGGATGCTAVSLVSDTQMKAAIAATAVASGSPAYLYVNAAGDAWAAGAQMKGTNLVSASSGTDYFCVDYAGAAKLVDTMTLSSAFTVCP
ncbi:MAG: type II secretion system protein [bacterium]